MTDWAAGVAVLRTPVTTTRSLAKATELPDVVVPLPLLEEVPPAAMDVLPLVLVPIDAERLEPVVAVLVVGDDVSEFAALDGVSALEPFVVDGAALPPPVPQLQMHAPTSTAKGSSRARGARVRRFNCMSPCSRTGRRCPRLRSRWRCRR
jgi:hypothetical protein